MFAFGAAIVAVDDATAVVAAAAVTVVVAAVPTDAVVDVDDVVAASLTLAIAMSFTNCSTVVFLVDRSSVAFFR